MERVRPTREDEQEFIVADWTKQEGNWQVTYQISMRNIRRLWSSVWIDPTHIAWRFELQLIKQAKITKWLWFWLCKNAHNRRTKHWSRKSELITQLVIFKDSLQCTMYATNNKHIQKPKHLKMPQRKCVRLKVVGKRHTRSIWMLVLQVSLQDVKQQFCHTEQRCLDLFKQRSASTAS